MQNEGVLTQGNVMDVEKLFGGELERQLSEAKDYIPPVITVFAHIIK